MKYPIRRQQKHTQKRYRVRNWREYDRALQRRGDLTLWFSPAAIEGWKARSTGRPGGQRVYTRAAIEAALSVRLVYGLALRQAEGFLRPVCRMLELEIPIPDHSTLSRRAAALGKLRVRALDASGPIHLLIDSTGLRAHAGNSGLPPRNRGWRKLHLAVDAATGDVAAVEITGRRVHDSRPVPQLLKQVDAGLVTLSADGAYDKECVYEAAASHAASPGRTVPQILIPPCRPAQLIATPSAAMRQRNRNLRSIRKRGRRRWHRESGYSRRSLVETAMFRFKHIVGRGLRARSMAGQQAEAVLGCRILNQMTALGMPDSVVVE
ncbi:MAG: IS5 family transposase [Acidobacteria bacterium]|nr:IS5 family transposase [Acidobacteriota bacterium]